MKDAGRIGLRVRGNYDVATEYEFLDIVYYSGASYIAKKDSIGNVPEDDSEYWHIFARGMGLESVVAGIKGASEAEYRQGYVVITPQDIGALPVDGKAASAQTADALVHTLTFTGSQTGSFDGSIDQTIEIPSPTAVKGGAETAYRTGDVDITKENIGLGKVADMTPEEIRAGLTAEEVENALGYSPSEVTITVDSELSNSSENPVQNKVIASKIDELSSEMTAAGNAQKQYTDTKIGDLINGAPETLDTLKEIADAIQENETIFDAWGTVIVNKVDKVAGKGLSTNDFTTAAKNKLAEIENGATNTFDVPTGLRNGYVQTGVKNGVIAASCSTAEGFGNSPLGSFDHCGGYSCETSARTNNYPAFASGYFCKAKGTCSFALGYMCEANVDNTISIGANCKANKMTSVCIGDSITSDSARQFVIGYYNAKHVDDNSMFIIGDSAFSYSNSFRVTDTAVFGKGAYNTSGADYAEFFEWEDGNANDEDRRGYFVTVIGNKIRIAQKDDNYILGVISATPVVIGNSDPDNWHKRFIKDEFGEPLVIYPEREILVPPDENKDEYRYERRRVKEYVLNPDFDDSLEINYSPRAERKEWSPVGMLGQLLVRDDGTCKINGYCNVLDGGIATVSDSGWRVIERINDHLVKILFR